METAEAKQQPTPSRTLRIPTSSYDTSKYSYQNVQNGNVYFLTFDTIDEAVNAYNTLKEDKLPVRYHVYSLFTKFDQEMTKEELENKVKSILGDTNYSITYVRVDNREVSVSHTGKVVIDKLSDCKNLLSFKDTEANHLRFYRFDPKKAIKRTFNAPKDEQRKPYAPKQDRSRRVYARNAQV